MNVIVISFLCQNSDDCSNEEAAASSSIPEEYKLQVLTILQSEEVVDVRDVHMVEDRQLYHVEWLPKIDRANGITG